jgi:hypothetical protein
MYDRVLQGAKPVELPIEQPMRFELMLYLKSAEAIDLDVAAAILAGATEILEEVRLPIVGSWHVLSPSQPLPTSEAGASDDEGTKSVGKAA